MGAGTKPVLLTLRALGLGDFLTAVPALRGLARAFPDHHKVLLCPKDLEPLAAATGAVDEVVHADFRSRPPDPLELSAPAIPPDIAVNLHGRGPHSHETLLTLMPRRLVAHAHRLIPVPGPPWDRALHEVDRWCRLLAWHGVPADPADLRLDVEAARPAWAGNRRCVVLHPGASSPARRWPAARWAEVARAQRVLGRPVLVAGGGAERVVALDIARRAGLPPESVIAGETSVWSLARLVAGASAVVANDSGPAHLATAVGTPSVVLFGPVPPSLWGPRIDRERHVAVWHGRRGHPHGRRAHPGLLEISVPEVLEALRTADRAAGSRARSYV